MTPNNAAANFSPWVAEYPGAISGQAMPEKISPIACGLAIGQAVATLVDVPNHTTPLAFGQSHRCQADA